jgi:predicted transcriptional regulator
MQKIKSTFTVSDIVIDELNQVAKELKEKKSHIVERALTMYFDLLDEKVADKRLKDLENKKDTLVDADDVFKELGI